MSTTFEEIRDAGEEKLKNIIYMLNLVDLMAIAKYNYNPICNKIVKTITKHNAVFNNNMYKDLIASIKKKITDLVIDDKISALRSAFNLLYNKPVDAGLDSDMSDDEAEPQQRPIHERMNCSKELIKKLEEAASNNLSLVWEVQPEFKNGEIVGVKDANGRWWLSRVVTNYVDNIGHVIWYYVHFENWSDALNEWVKQGDRIMQFNPRKHHLKRR